MTLANATCKLPENGVLTPKHGGVIYYKFTVLMLCIFWHIINNLLGHI